MFNIIFVVDNNSNTLQTNIKFLEKEDCKIYVVNRGKNTFVIPNIEVFSFYTNDFIGLNKLLYKITGDVVILTNNITINRHFYKTLLSTHDDSIVNLFRVDDITNSIKSDKRIGKIITSKDIKYCMSFNTNLISYIDNNTNNFYDYCQRNNIRLVLQSNIRVFNHIIKYSYKIKRMPTEKPTKRSNSIRNIQIDTANKITYERQLNKISELSGTTYSIIIPFMYNGDRFPLFMSCLDNLYDITKNISNIEIAVHETSPKQYITDKIIKKYNLNYVFTKHIGTFDIAYNYNFFCKNHIDSDVFIFFDADIIIEPSWLYNLLSSDDNKCYIGWSTIKYFTKAGTINYIKNKKCLQNIRPMRTTKYIKNVTTGGINIIPRKIFFDVKGWPEDFRKLGYGCIDHSMTWKLNELYGVTNFSDTIYHLKHKHKTNRTDDRFVIRDEHKNFNKNDWVDYISNIQHWG